MTETAPAARGRHRADLPGAPPGDLRADVGADPPADAGAGAPGGPAGRLDGDPDGRVDGDADGSSVDGDAELVIAFLNTVDTEAHTDVLDRDTGWRGWSTKHGGRQADPLATARAARHALRAAALGADPAVLPAPPMRVEIVAGVPVLAADTAVGAVLAAAVRLGSVGAWNRIKICPAADCGSAFYDASRNRSRTWCSMRVCGNRAKARTWRSRRL